METSVLVKIEYEGNLVCEIDNKTPTFTDLIEFVNSKESIDVEKFSVSKIEKFDSDGFLNIIKTSIKDYMKQKNINAELFKKLKKKLSERL